MMKFDPEDDNCFVFRSESTEEIETSEKGKDNENEMDRELEKELLNELDNTNWQKISLLVMTGKTLSWKKYRRKEKDSL